MSKNPVAFILLLTLITIVAWIVLQVFQIQTKPISTPDQKLMQELNPELDKSVLEELKKSLK
ncbi:MAG: hypothetical protein A2126_02490 [Candidatus Woykebacteria bacterium GWB1_45_5]|uniref:Uncharacterized protein n=2 Tax=Candidatus Woykeibacteriota TaxID=1817899 RepID=A0A1G1W135_9BACT|nr:MAG: hypothetical protein A2113_00150 [Candidatus Woykebacteria bacterium GWA1_44_8]OGY23689.1 MAG: hypothetical protein A2126_02490 [Candidatus Woykebacteria bacterium GWB1_45_5]